MRILSFIFVLIFTAGISAQSKVIMRPFNEGTKLARSGDFEKALASYRVAFDLAANVRTDNKFLARLHYNIGVCEYRLNRLDEAIADLHLATRLREGNYPEAFYAIGMAELALENWQAAEFAFLEATKLVPSNGEAWFDLAFAYLGERDFLSAESAFLNSIKYNSEAAPLSHNNVGVIRGMRGDFSSAEKEFQAAIKLSGGKLTIAKDNLEYCRTHVPTDFFARSEFEFTGRNGTMF